MTNLERAFLVAEKAHANQTYNIYPYGYHLRQVVQLAQGLGYEESILVAAALHDTLEDTHLSYKDLSQAFGEEVAEIVYCVTDELGRNRKERKAKTYPKIKGNWKAAVVKICDRIANMAESKANNPKLFAMYQAEHQDFYKNIWSKDHPIAETEKAWKKLNELALT